MEQKINEMLEKIDDAIKNVYKEIEKTGQVMSEIRRIHRQVRFKNYELAEHIKNRMEELEKEKAEKEKKDKKAG